MKKKIQRFIIKLFRVFGSKYKTCKAAKCGHTFKVLRRNRTTRLYIHGLLIKVQIGKNKTHICPKCFSEQCIRCAWCGQSIMPGHPITLNSPINSSAEFPNYAVFYSKAPIQVVGCLRWDCPGCGSGAERAGFWLVDKNGKTFVHRVTSPLEMAFNSNSLVSTGDVSSIQEAMIQEKNYLESQQTNPE